MSNEEQLRIAMQPTRERLDKIAQRTSEPVRNLLLSIAANYCASDCRVYKLCREATMKDQHLKWFRREIGISPKRLIQECQRETSSVLLRDTELNIRPIALLIGFQCASSLRRIYRDLAGISPTEMRRCLRGVVPELQTLGDELRGWYFLVREHRGELTSTDYADAVAYHKNRFG